MSGEETQPSATVLQRPRTISPGARPGSTPVVRPRTIEALGRPEPLSPLPPPLEALEDPAWQPTTGSVPAIALHDLDVQHPDVDLDADLWTETGQVPIAVPTKAKQGVPRRARNAPPATEAPPRMLRNNALVASGTALSRLTGLLRTVLIFTLFFKTLKDSYNLANNTPNIIYELILGGVLTATLVPLFTDDLENGDGDATSAVVSFTVVVLAVLALVTAALSPVLIWFYARGAEVGDRAAFQSAGLRLAVLFAPQVFFYGLMALWSAVLNARHRFFAAAWAPVLNNLVVIGVLVTTWRLTDGKPTARDILDRPGLLLFLGLGTSVGIVVMALSLYPAVRRSGVRIKFRFRPRHPAVRRALRLSVWTFGYVIANQIAGAIVSILAVPGSGGPTDYSTSFQFFQLPHGLLAVSIMVTFEPLLGRADARGDRKMFNEQLLKGFRLIGLLIVPAAIGYIALPQGLNYAVDPSSGSALGTILRLGSIVGAFAVGLPGFSTYLYALRGFYAMKNTRTPFYVNCFENGVNIVAAVIFVRLWGVVGLALAYSLAYTVAAIVAVRLLARSSEGFDLRGLVTSWLKLIVAGVVMGGFVYGFLALVAPNTTPLVVLSVGTSIFIGAFTYFLGVYALRIPGVSDAFARLPFGRRSPGRG